MAKYRSMLMQTRVNASTETPTPAHQKQRSDLANRSIDSHLP